MPLEGPSALQGPAPTRPSPSRVALEAPRPIQLQTGSQASAEPAPEAGSGHAALQGPCWGLQGAPSGHIEGKGHPGLWATCPEGPERGQVPLESLGGQWPLARPCPAVSLDATGGDRL